MKFLLKFLPFNINYVIYGSMGILISIIIGLSSYIIFMNKKIDDLESKNLVLIERIATQDSLISLRNKEIEKKSIEIEKYKNIKPKIVEKVVTKYRNIEIKGDSCEAEIDSMKNLLDSFNRN